MKVTYEQCGGAGCIESLSLLRLLVDVWTPHGDHPHHPHHPIVAPELHRSIGMSYSVQIYITITSAWRSRALSEFMAPLLGTLHAPQIKRVLMVFKAAVWCGAVVVYGAGWCGVAIWCGMAVCLLVV